MDTSLVTRAQRGDEGAFASLAVAIGDRLHAVAFRILRDTDLAEDATQQALLNVWQDLSQLRDPARFDAWSYHRRRPQLVGPNSSATSWWLDGPMRPRRNPSAIAESQASVLRHGRLVSGD